MFAYPLQTSAHSLPDICRNGGDGFLERAQEDSKILRIRQVKSSTTLIRNALPETFDKRALFDLSEAGLVCEVDRWLLEPDRPKNVEKIRSGTDRGIVGDGRANDE